MYKVFLVEDEIVAREGIRDHVDWRSAGFEFSGEAPDGEIALPLIEAAQPDVLITDIKMPFMDGLQLCKIIREHMPWIKIIFLSGHNEFDYAQAAIKMGVSEYLLKPVSAKDLGGVLQRMAASLDKEKNERESLKRLRDQVQDNLVLLRENFLLRLVVGMESSAEAVEQGQQLGLNILARWYMVGVIHIRLANGDQPVDFHRLQQVERLVAEMARDFPEVLLTKKGLEEIVLILKGESAEQLQLDGSFLVEMILKEVEEKTGSALDIALGSPQQRLGEIHHSFAEALAKVNRSAGRLHPAPSEEESLAELIHLDQTEVEKYLKFGASHDFDHFFEAYIQSIGKAALRSSLVKNYIFMDVVLTSAQFVSDLGGNVDQVIPEIRQIEKLLTQVHTVEQIRDGIRRVLENALDYRDNQVTRERAKVIHQARDYIDQHFTDAELSLHAVAAKANLSSSHFSVVFSHETGETFRDYLTRKRIERAKELLRTTSIKCAEVAYQSGYNDPHYFSFIFRKISGLSPQQFRAQSRARKA
jgi:two-component system response regulator YesN